MGKKKRLKHYYKQLRKYQNEEQQLLKLLNGYQNELRLIEHTQKVKNNEKTCLN